MKFKVGDKVRIAKPHIWFKNKYVGKIYTITEIKSELEKSYILNGTPYIWHENELKLVKENKTFFKKLPNDYTGTLEVENGYIVEKEILDEEEKEYLSAVIRPLKNKIEYIVKQGDNKEYIYIFFENNEYMAFPYFKKGTMYKGMKLYKKYTLKELGLDE